MNITIKFCLFFLQIAISADLFSSFFEKTELEDQVIVVSQTLGQPYQLAQLPDQNNTFCPKIEPVRQASNLWGLLFSETPQEHVLRVISSGQMNDACSLSSDFIERNDPKFLELLPIVTSEEFQKLRKNYLKQKTTFLELLEESRKKNNEIIFNISLLLKSINSNTSTQKILSPSKKDLFLQALSATIEQQTELFGVFTKEHAALVSTLEKIKEDLENKL